MIWMADFIFTSSLVDTYQSYACWRCWRRFCDFDRFVVESCCWAVFIYCQLENLLLQVIFIAISNCDLWLYRLRDFAMTSMGDYNLSFEEAAIVKVICCFSMSSYKCLICKYWLFSGWAKHHKDRAIFVEKHFLLHSVAWAILPLMIDHCSLIMLNLFNIYWVWWQSFCNDLIKSLPIYISIYEIGM